jgi:hypothetical protein
MKDKILMLILGILIGAVITAACFLLFSKNNPPRFTRGNGERMMDANFIPGQNPMNRGQNGDIQPNMNTIL